MLDPELLFLTVKFLESCGCIEGALAVKNFIIKSKALPPRINYCGDATERSYEDFVSSYGDISPTALSAICSAFVNSNSIGRSPCLLSLHSVLGAFICQNKENNFTTDCVHRCLSSEFGRKSIAKSSACLKELYRKVHLRRHVLAHRAVIYWLKFDRRSELIITASDDYTIKLWCLQSTNNLEVPFLRHTLRGHAAEIVGVDLSIDNHLLASADADCSLVIWCLRTGQQLVSFRGCRNNRAISGLRFIPFLPKTKLADGERSPVSRQSLDPDTSRVILTYSYYKTTIGHSSLSNCTGWLLVAAYSGGLHFIPYKHETVGGASASTSSSVDCCILRLNPTVTIDNLEASVLSLDISPGDHFIAVGCSDNFVRMYTFAENGLPVAAGRLFAREDGLNKLRFSNSGTMLATSSSNGGTCWLWKLQSCLWTGAELKLRKRPRCRPCLLQWTKDDRYLVVSTKSGSVYVFLAETGEVANVLRGHEGAVYAVAVSPFDEEIIATGGVDGRFYIWNLTAHRRRGPAPAPGPGQAQGSSSPVLAFYRYPRPQMETDLGIAWPLPQHDHQEQPLPQALGPYASGVRGGDESGEPATAPRGGAGGGSSSASLLINSRNSLMHNYANNSNRAGGGGGSSMSQQITVCVAAPAAEGPAFLVATKAGVISLFAFSGCPASETAGEESVIPYEEQFLHWEMDAAELHEVSVSEDPQSAAVAIALGSPPCQQSFSSPGRAAYGSRASGAVVEMPLSPRVEEQQQQQQQRPLVLTNVYRPPPGVLFQLVHAPSQVPFNRLPPAYLTTLKGCVYPLERQRQQIYGRGHLSRPLDLQPTLAFDEDGEEVVVDDIQFCCGVPASYCHPPPRQTVVQGAAGKNYLWRCHWLCDGNSIVAPLSASELDLTYRRLTELNQLEREHFQAPAVVSRVTAPMPIECDISPSVGIPSTSNCLNSPIDLGAVASSSALPTLAQQEDAVSTVLSPSDAPTSPLMNTSMTPGGPDPPQSDAEYAPSDSEESEWSAHIDAEIGWWQRRRRRRPRRTADEARTVTANGSQPVAFGTSAQSEEVILVSETLPTETNTNQNTVIGSVSSLSGALRRSARQRRRILAQTRVEREQSRAASRTSQLQAARHLRRARRSERLRRFLQDTAAANATTTTTTTTASSPATGDDSTSRDALIDHRGRNREQFPLMSASQPKSREVMKQQLIRSIDYTSVNRIKLPLEHPPPLGYSAPLTCRDPNTSQSLHNDTSHGAWPGPDLDWLSATAPIASPYVPQLGDHVVYIVRGHKEYLEKAWQGGRVPPLDQSQQSPSSSDNASLNSMDLRLPWEEHPSLPGYICCRVDELAFHFMRINSGGQPSHHHRGGGERSRRHHLSSAVRRRRPLASSSNRLRRSPFCTLGDTTNQEPEPGGHTSTPALTIDASAPQPADSFVRLATLRLTVEASQPYVGIGSQGSTSNATASLTALPRDLLIRYHDVDGVLDFIVLRNLFNESLSRSWSTGEVFVCPVDDVWWRGRVLSPFPALLSSPQQSASVSVTWSQPSPPLPAVSTDQSAPAGSLPLLLSPRDPWLGVRVRWLENEECGSAQEPLLPPSLWAAAAATSGRADPSGAAGSRGLVGGGASFDLESLSQGRGRFRGDPHADTRVLLPDRSPGKPMLLPPTGVQSEPDVVLTFSDYLSPWDMHLWTSRLPVSDSPIPSTSSAVATTSASVSFLRSSEVRLPSVRLTELFGSGCYVADHPSFLLPLVRRMEHFMDKIMSLGAAEAFINPVDLAAYPNYLIVNPYLVDLLFIRQRLHNLFYREVDAIRFDIEQVHANAVRYNEPNSLIVRQAQLITTLAVRALDDPSYTEEAMLEAYTAAIHQEHALDPNLQLPPSPPVTIPPVSNMTSAAHPGPEESSSSSPATAATTTALPGRSAHQHPTSSTVYPSPSSPPPPPPPASLKRTRHGGSEISETNCNSALRLSGAPIKRLHLEAEAEEDDAVAATTAVAAPTHQGVEDIHSRLRQPPAAPLRESSPPGFRDWQQACCSLLTELRRSRRSVFFRQPVDVTQYPTYTLFVQTPMDLSTMKQRLQPTGPAVGSGGHSSPHPDCPRLSSAERQSSAAAAAASCYYTSARDFLADLNLIVTNSRSFNRSPGTQVYADTRWLSKWIRKVAQRRLGPFLAARAPGAAEETIVLVSPTKPPARSRSTSTASVPASSRTAAAAGAGARLRVAPLRLRRSPETARLHFCAQKVKRRRQRQRQLSSRLASRSVLSRNGPSVSNWRPDATMSRYHLRSPPVIDVSASTPVPVEHSNSGASGSSNTESYGSDIEVTSVRRKQPAAAACTERRTSRGRISRPPARPDDNFEALPTPRRRPRRRQPRRTATTAGHRLVRTQSALVAQSQPSSQLRDRPRRTSVGVRRYYYSDEDEDEDEDYYNSDAFVVV